MALPKAFQIGLHTYEVPACSDEVRAEVWSYLAPHMSAIAGRYLDKTAKHATVYQDVIREERENLERMIIEHTARLFRGAFDEDWVTGVRRRAEEERQFGFDMRNRTVIAQTICSSLLDILGEKSFCTKRKATQLADTATRILFFDAAVATNLHYAHEARQLKARAEGSSQALRNLSEAVEESGKRFSEAIGVLRTTSSELADSAARATSEVLNVTNAARASAHQINATAAGSEQLATSAVEVHSQAVSSASRASQARDHMANANLAIGSLAEAAIEIHSIVDMISGIATQTNLLSLNAAIEATRSGVAGQGFNVVAQEIKALSRQTAEATTKISKRIVFIEEATRKSVSEVKSAAQDIAEIAAIAEQVSTSANEQARATNNISGASSQVAANASIVATGIDGLTQTIQRMNKAAEVTRGVSEDLLAKFSTVQTSLDTLVQMAVDQLAQNQVQSLSADTTIVPEKRELHA